MAKTDHLGTWLKRAGLMEGMRPHCAYLPSNEWGELAAEIAEMEQYAAIRTQPTNKTFNRLNLGVGNLTLVNAQTEDVEVCNALNWQDLGEDAKLLELRAQVLLPTDWKKR